MEELKSKYSKEINQLNEKQNIVQGDFIKQHQSHTVEMRDKQRQTLESMVNNLNTKLKDLVNAADLHWDDHDKFHKDGEGNEVEEEAPKLKPAGGRAVVNGQDRVQQQQPRDHEK